MVDVALNFDLVTSSLHATYYLRREVNKRGGDLNPNAFQDAGDILCSGTHGSQRGSRISMAM